MFKDFSRLSLAALDAALHIQPEFLHDELQGEERATKVLVTPELAKAWLARNTENRPLRKMAVDALAGANLRGEWRLTASGIGFDRDGKLVDGQHRLHMIVQSNKPAALWVMTGLDPDVYKVIDMGVKRSLGDRAKISKSLAAICNIILDITDRTAYASADAALLIAEHDVGRAHKTLLAHCGSRRKVMSCAAMQLAASIRMTDGSSSVMYVLEQYRALCTLDMASMSGASTAMCKAVINGLGSMNTDDILTRGLKVFSQANRSLALIKASSEEISRAKKEVRRIFEPTIKSLRGDADE